MKRLSRFAGQPFCIILSEPGNLMETEREDSSMHEKLVIALGGNALQSKDSDATAKLNEVMDALIADGTLVDLAAKYELTLAQQ